MLNGPLLFSALIQTSTTP